MKKEFIKKIGKHLFYYIKFLSCNYFISTIVAIIIVSIGWVIGYLVDNQFTTTEYIWSIIIWSIFLFIVLPKYSLIKKISEP